MDTIGLIWGPFIISSVSAFLAWLLHPVWDKSITEHLTEQGFKGRTIPIKTFSFEVSVAQGRFNAAVILLIASVMAALTLPFSYPAILFFLLLPIGSFLLVLVGRKVNTCIYERKFNLFNSCLFSGNFLLALLTWKANVPLIELL